MKAIGSRADSPVLMQLNINDVGLDCMDDEEFSIFRDLVDRCINSSDRAQAMQDYPVRDGDSAVV